MQSKMTSNTEIDRSIVLPGNQNNNNESTRLALIALLCQDHSEQPRVFSGHHRFDSVATQSSGAGTVTSSLLNTLLIHQLQRDFETATRPTPSNLNQLAARSPFSLPPYNQINISDNQMLESSTVGNRDRWRESANVFTGSILQNDFEKRRMDTILRTLSGPMSNNLLGTVQPPEPSFLMERIVSRSLNQQKTVALNLARRPPLFNPMLQKSDATNRSCVGNSCPPMCTTKGVSVTGRESVMLSQSRDVDVLSEYQCFVREQIEFFEANDEDIASTAKGRNKPIILGQVGIRCRHCAAVPPKYRLRGAMYYPKKMRLIYQAAQTIAGTHLYCPDGGCPLVPEDIKIKLSKLQKKKSLLGGGKVYWDKAAEAVGVKETEACLRFCDE